MIKLKNTLVIAGLLSGWLCNANAWYGPLVIRDTPIQKIVVAGDSTCDVWNIYNATGGVWPIHTCDDGRLLYFEGRFSDGKLAVERLAEELRLELKPSSQGGTNYAYAAASSGDGYIQRDTERFAHLVFGDCFTDCYSGNMPVIEKIPNLGQQVENYLEAVYGSVPGDALIVISAGSNDKSNGIKTFQTAINIEKNVRTLYEKGGRFFLVPNFPPFEEVPRVMEGRPDWIPELLYKEGVRFFGTRRYNKYLTESLSKLASEFEDIVIINPDIYKASKDYLSNLDDEHRREALFQDCARVEDETFATVDKLHAADAVQEAWFQEFRYSIDEALWADYRKKQEL